MENYEKYVGMIFDGRYRIQRIIGLGGMAVVFEAEDLLMHRTVAVKMLKEGVGDDATSVKRFINESKAVSMLSHPNIVSIYDVSVREDLKYITDIAPEAAAEMSEKFGKRFFATPKKMGAETAEANINAGLAAANQIVDFFKTGNTRFQVNK